jgi:hypothetical protein
VEFRPTFAKERSPPFVSRLPRPSTREGGRIRRVAGRAIRNCTQALSNHAANLQLARSDRNRGAVLLLIC